MASASPSAAARHHGADPEQRTAVDVLVAELDPYGTPHTTTGRPVVPSALTELLCEVRARYAQLPPIWITENGSAEADTVSPDGHVHDPDRIGHLADHDQRFGLVHIDYDTLTRTPQDSYHWYRGLITAHRARTEEPAR
ncbi:family 1 glycosylhydrolase [Streptomyces sp. NPDC001530]|uniref:family 1 glycosylhydrolase n=1 Tax=Streptomyces sp. NPDC001530 TaxID=3364582 RepID=UPI0036BBF09D